MKRLMFLCLVLLTVFTVQINQVDAAEPDPFSLFLLNLADLKSDEVNPVDTYEDVDPIKNIQPQFKGYGPIISNGALMSTYGSPVKAATGQAFISKIEATSGMIFTHAPMNFFDFLTSAGKFYLDSGEFDKDNVWHPEKQFKFPFDYEKTKNPHYKKFQLCIKGGFQYIKPFNMDPDAKSCHHNKDWCNYPPCVKEEKEDGDEDSDGVPNETTVEENHPDDAPFNVYSNLGQTIKDKYLVSAGGAQMKESGMEFSMNFKDRTPPIIEGCVGDDFPELGKVKPASTGDWYKVDGLKIIDNSTEKIGTCLAIGKIDAFPATSWKSEEDWIIEAPRILESGDETDYIILPNSCHGVMRYSVFAWDENGLVNPGEPRIENDKPEICYGLREPPDGKIDLKRDPLTAEPWPIKIDFAQSTGIDYVKANITPGDRRGEGLVHIRDNDLPNLIIRIESVKDKSRVFFPPVIAPGDLTIIPSTEYKKAAAIPEANAVDYQSFLGPVPAIPYSTEKLQDPMQPLYFQILDVIPSPVMTEADKGLMLKFKEPAEHLFTRKHFRLEDYNQSDTLPTDGSPDLSPDNFGQRCGFGESVVALLDLPGNNMIQEDVEYLIDIWADDNVKWATIDNAGAVLDNIVSIPTGIVEGEMSVIIPNQYPPVSHQVKIDKNESVNGKLRVVFREPTPPGGIKTEADLIARKFPWIEARVKDYAGMTRKIKLYIRVSNENPDIRVIDRKHEKRD